ncbi:EAL domain-containing protein, partial [Pseudomonas sp. Kh7]|uniref:EAL domain-containing protein n=1 Tax=Pseudomonas sp. Kh7 TaxID=2093743 RepID=UPI0011865BF9
SMLREYRIKDHQVCIELTEHTAIGNLQSANATIAKLRAQGLMIAIDDFGTGYSSLSYLLELAADKVKIDRSFLARFPSTESSTIYKT